MKKDSLPSTKLVTITQFLNNEKVKKYVENMLQDRAPQFITSLVSLSNLTPGLSNVDPKSLLYCGLKAASLNLPLDNNLGFAYAIPYSGEAQFQIGYRGLIQLAQRTGQYRKINVTDVREGELKKWDAFKEELELEMEPDLIKRDKLPVIGYAAMFELVNGYTKIVYWPREKVEKHGKRFSKTYNRGPWQTDFDAMAKKTVLKDLLSKWGPLSTELQEAIKFDQAVIRETETGETVPDYVDVEFAVAPESQAQEDLEQFLQTQETKE